VARHRSYLSIVTASFLAICFASSVDANEPARGGTPPAASAGSSAAPPSQADIDEDDAVFDPVEPDVGQPLPHHHQPHPLGQRPGAVEQGHAAR